MRVIDNTRLNFILLLTLLVAPITGISIDIFAPSLPYIQHYFHVSPALARFSIVIYLFGYGLSLLPIGSLVDYLGRRKILMISLFSFTIVSLVAALSTNINVFLLSRFLQGVSVAGPSITTKAILTDCFQGKKLMRSIAYNGIAWSIGPILAPVLGGYLQHFFGWRASFYFLAIFGAITFLIIYQMLPETMKNKHDLKFSVICRNYHRILTHKIFIFSAIILALLYSVVTVFNVQGPFLIQTLLHYSAVDYGHFSLLMGFAWLLGNMVNRFLIEKVSMLALKKYGLYSAIALTMLMLALSELFPLNLTIILSFTFGLIFLVALVFPIGYMQCISQFPNHGGSANSMMVSAYIVGSAVMTGFASIVKINNQIPLAIIYLILVLAAVSMNLFLQSQENPKKSKTQNI